jgi:phosphoribosylformimino-5-aminoimidazole carboxamide ribotide isomerase
MIVIPAIDMRGGKVVRLVQGDFSKQITYGDDPVAVARQWAEAGAQRLHLVDLDGALTGTPHHLPQVAEIAKSVKVPVQVGGGIRSFETIDDYLKAGVATVILGTKACMDKPFMAQAAVRYSGYVAAAVDVKEGRVAVEGWAAQGSLSADQAVEQLLEQGVGTIVYTEIARDGMMSGPAIERYRQLLEQIKNRARLIASGGIHSLDDLLKLKELNGLWGAITGRALYDGKINLKEAIQKCSPSGSSPAST